MAQTYMTSPLDAGETSRAFSLPVGNHHGHTYRRTFLLNVHCDRGIEPHNAAVSVQQGKTALAKIEGSGGSVYFTPDPAAGECVIRNQGPADVALTVSDPER